MLYLKYLKQKEIIVVDMVSTVRFFYFFPE